MAKALLSKGNNIVPDIEEWLICPEFVFHYHIPDYFSIYIELNSLHSSIDFSSLVAFATPSSRHPLVHLGDPSHAWLQDARYMSGPCILHQHTQTAISK